MRVVMPSGNYKGEAVISGLSKTLKNYYQGGDDKWEVEHLPGTRQFRLTGAYGGTVEFRDYAGLRAQLYTRVYEGPRGLPKTQWIPKTIPSNGTDIPFELTLVPISTSELCREFELTYSHTVAGRESEMSETVKKSLITLLERFLHNLYEAHNAEAA